MHKGRIVEGTVIAAYI